ncbi:hypothetical protein ACLIKE_03465 [Ferroplasma acidiphilum]|uniref:Uncharacterized protein n=1 Tax=Ferroplasma acidiphilum TaxID=74969 RepID=A0A7K4FLC3_9ARCH|nr:hypothetical protein [Ferroplasma acidarmanus]NOL59581.1 hypothetical protein [Ferroplasma acidiphilum]HIH60346.1 hypothetical protein [Ferroplasma sp.]
MDEPAHGGLNHDVIGVYAVWINDGLQPFGSEHCSMSSASHDFMDCGELAHLP